MTLDGIDHIAAALNSARSDTLGATSDEVKSAAHAHDISIIPATMFGVPSIELDPELRGADVVELAAASGARLTYLSKVVVDTSPMITIISDTEDSSEGQADKKKILRALRRIDGYTSSVEVGFAHGGILHTWTRTATWADELEELDELQYPFEDTDSGPLHPSMDSEGRQQITAALVADPAFRRARSHKERETAALALPAVAQLDDSATGRIVYLILEANQALRQEHSILHEDMRGRISELAPLLAASSKFRSAHTAGGRKDMAHEWVADNHSNGLRMNNSLINELAVAARALPVDQLNLI